MVDKEVNIEEEEKGDRRDQHSHNIKTDPTKEDDFNCNVDGDGVVGDEEDGGVRSDSAVLRSMLAASSGVVGAHHINGPTSANNEELESAMTAGGVGAGTVMFVPNNMAEVSADVDVEATPVCPDAWLVDDEVQVAVEVLQDDVNSENETEEEREADDGEVPSKDFHKQPKRNVFLGLLALCAVVGISVAVAVPLSRRSSPDEEESGTIDQAVPWEVATTSSTTDDDKIVHKAPVPSFISDALSVKYTQLSQGIGAPGSVSFYGDCRTAAISVDEGAVQIVKYNEIYDMWDVMNELREDGFGAEIELAKINQVLAVSRPNDEPNNTGSIKVYELNSYQKWSRLGDDIDGTKPSLSVEGDVLASVVHVADEDDRVRVYRFEGTENWAQLGSDIIVGESRKTYARISQFGDYLVLGATLDELGLGSLRVFKLNDEEEWSQVGKTLYDESSDYPSLINMHGDTIATSGFDMEGLPRSAVYRYQPDEDEWTQEGSFNDTITAMSADGKRLGMCSSQRQVCCVHNYYDISKEYGEVATYTDFVPLHFERGGFSNLESGVCGIATSKSKTTIGYTTVPW